MHTHETPRRLQQNLSVQQVGTETLVYDELRHKAFCLNQSSALIWKLSDGENTVPQIAAAASRELGMDVGAEFVAYAIKELRDDGLIEPSPVAQKNISRRLVLQRIGVGGAMLLPAVSTILAPTAAQAYSGCFDCTSVSPGVSPAVRARQLARAQAAAGGSSGLNGDLAPLGSPSIQPLPQRATGSQNQMFPDFSLGPDLTQ